MTDTINDVDNIIVLQRGTKYPDEYVVCGAHYDSYCNGNGHPDSLRAPGADDNASGVAGIMEIARILSNYKFERSILYCNFNAEEVGLYGSAAFAKECADNDVDIVGYLNLDMTGYLKDDTEMHVDLLYIDRDSLLGACFSTSQTFTIRKYLSITHGFSMATAIFLHSTEMDMLPYTLLKMLYTIPLTYILLMMSLDLVSTTYLKANYLPSWYSAWWLPLQDLTALL